MRKLALLIAMVAAAGAGGSQLAESRIVTAVRQLTEACVFSIARGIAPKDPVDFARRPPAIRVDDAAEGLLILAEGDAPPAPARTRPAAVSSLEPPLMAVPISRDLASILADAKRERREACSVLASTGPEAPGRHVG